MRFSITDAPAMVITRRHSHATSHPRTQSFTQSFSRFLSQSRPQRFSVPVAPAYDRHSDSTSLVNGNDQPQPESEPQSILQSIRIHICRPKFIYLSLLTLAFMFLAAANQILYKKTLNAYGNIYSYWVTQFTTLVYDVIALLVVLFKLAFTQSITKEMRQLPKGRFILMGLFDCLGNLLSAFGGVNTPGQLQTLISQLVVPITMLGTFLALKRRYTYGQVIGAIIIIAGASLAVIPLFLPNNPNSDNTAVKWYSVCIFILSTVPIALNVVYKEWALKSYSIDVVWLTTWVSWSQFFWGLLFFPLVVVPGLATPTGESISEAWDNIVGGFQCFVGISASKTVSCSSSNTSVILVFCALNFLFNINGLLITKHGSATLQAIATSCSLPLSNIAFSLAIIMGAQQEQFTVEDGVGLALVVVGFLLFSLLGSDASDELPVLLVEQEGEEGGGGGQGVVVVGQRENTDQNETEEHHVLVQPLLPSSSPSSTQP